MPIVKIQRMPGLPKEIYSADSGTVLSDFLMRHNVSADVRVIYNKSIMSDDDDIDIALADGDEVAVFDQPHGGDLIKTLLNPLEHFNPIKFTQKVFSQLTKQPSVGKGSQQKTSPNNSIKEQTNTARNGEARPDTYGQVRAYPDLIQQSLVEYINNLKYVREWMNFGLGFYDIEQVRYSESSIGAMPGASFSVFNPGQVIPQIIQPYAFDDVDGQEVPGPNENSAVVIESATTTSVTTTQYAGGELQVKIPKNATFDYFMQLVLPHSVTFTVNVTYPTPSGNVTENITLFGTLISAVETDDGTIPVPNEFYTFTINQVNGVGSGNFTSGTINPVLFTISDNQAFTIGPFFSPIESSDLWVNMVSQLSGDNHTRWQVKIWKVDAGNNQIPGTTQTFDYVQTNPDESVSQSVYRTDKITPTGGFGRYAVSVTRTNNSNDGSKLVVEGITCINYRNNVVYPDDTIITVSTRATKNASTAKDRKFNALITRRTIGYNRSTGLVINTLSSSRSFADAVLHTWIVMAKQPLSMLDVATLYEIADSLDDPRFGYFDFTFDDEDQALGERIQTICDAARVIAFWDDGIMSFVRDEKRDYPATIFNTANTKQGQYSLSYDMTLPGGFDGVQVQYRNPTTNKQGYVYYKVDGNNVVPGMPVKPKKLNMLYIRNLYQATDRAILECRKLIYSRQSMSIQALGDGEWINVGDMVQVIDMYDNNQQSGKITGRNGNVFYTSETIDFTGNMFVVITDKNGTPTDRYAATPVDGNKKAFSAAIPTIDLAIWDGVDIQSPSRYAIASQDELDRTLWTVTAKQPGVDGSTGVTVSEYSHEMYDYLVPAS
ncbi:host specificity factor TipJ family phage tail protein [Escherichia coli]|uniref:host specificity factor TipJ family phage tail protein n=1 Tax=Escherichia coli TaxID=562 RepID=UPI001F56B8F5|nr:host specificity factor TipJ family phage tail protein [Escherichia coli]MCI2234023.1 host specificity factor TipJ family phage tail protein [Escherichia coli]